MEPCNKETQWTSDIILDYNNTRNLWVWLLTFGKWINFIKVAIFFFLVFKFMNSFFRVKWRCCYFDGLRQGNTLKNVVLENGDEFKGGEVTEHGDIVAFDLIKEVYVTASFAQFR